MATKADKLDLRCSSTWKRKIKARARRAGYDEGEFSMWVRRVLEGTQDNYEGRMAKKRGK